jgi:hypothetical protein
MEAACLHQKRFALAGGLFGVGGIVFIAGGNLLPGGFMSLAAIALALRANAEWKREQA